MNKFVRTRSHAEVNFPKHLWAFMHVSCAPILHLSLLFFSAASVGATAERQIQNRVFGHFFTTLENDSVANYISIWMPFRHLLED